MTEPFILHQGDCLEVLRTFSDNSIDSIVTDPPYGLSKEPDMAEVLRHWLAGDDYQHKGGGFMGKTWDSFVPGPAIWRECLRVLKPGGHLLAFFGTRTQDIGTLAIRLAGFEIRDSIVWVYGSGFPKSMDVSKAIDKAGGRIGQSVIDLKQRLIALADASGKTRSAIDAECGFRATNYLTLPADGKKPDPWVNCLPPREKWATMKRVLGADDSLDVVFTHAEREVLGVRQVVPGVAFSSDGPAELDITAPATDAARQWQGWGTALKPALETVTFASKPYTDEQERDIMLSNLIRLEARLWLLSSASAAEKNSTSSQSEYGAACAIAQWSADEITSTRAALCDPMGMSLFELATTTSLNIVSSWRRTLAESWSDGSTSTTETKSSTTTDWRTLKFSLSQITPSTIIRACSLPGGFSVNASTAESHFNASLSLLQSIRTLSATERAMSQAQHEHQGAGVKPNLDPCTVARKPLTGTVAANVLAHGTGALNIDGCRIPLNGDYKCKANGRPSQTGLGDNYDPATANQPDTAGRWPANLIHDGSEEVVALFPANAGASAPVKGTEASEVTNGIYGKFAERVPGSFFGDNGSAARFFYCAKASRKDRNEGLTDPGPQFQHGTTLRKVENTTTTGNHHPTVKPTDLMAYLCRLVTPPGGVVLDPFMGSGSTGKAAMREGFRFIGCERDEDGSGQPLGYMPIAEARINFEWQRAKAQAQAEESAAGYAQLALFNGSAT